MKRKFITAGVIVVALVCLLLLVNKLGNLAGFIKHMHGQ